jgi:membrane-associated protein
MESIAQFLTDHAKQAHWFIFLGVLLAGCNIPISIDLLVILAAVLAVHFVPEHLFLLYTFLLIGCGLSAWIAYFLGRYLGHTLAGTRLFKPILHPQKIEKISKFYQKYGIWTFIVGRFIPFGVRNCIFMTSGLSKMPFSRFMYREAVACFIWVTFSFSLFCVLGQNFDRIWHNVKTFNLFIFLAFSVAVISMIWYKQRKKHRATLKNNASYMHNDLPLQEHKDQNNN